MAADRRLAGGATAFLGVGTVLALVGAGGGSLVLTIAGGMTAGLALVVLMAPRWIEPTLLAAVAVPLPAIWSGGGVRVAGAAPFAAAIVAAWVLSRTGRETPARAGTLPLRTLGLLALVLVVVTAVSPHPAVAARKFLNLSLLAGLLFAATDYLAQGPALRVRLATMIALLGALCGALAVLETVGVLPAPFPNWGTPLNRAALGFGQPNGLGLYLAVVLPLVAWRASDARGAARWGWWGALALAAGGLLGTFSRGSWAALLLGAGALAAAGDWKRSLRVMGGALLVAVVLDLVSGGSVRDRIAVTVGDWTVEQRAALMLAGVLMFLDSPWVGFGPGGYEAELDRFGILVPELYDFQATPHNAYIQWGAEAGVFGFALYVAILALLVRACAAAVRASANPQDAALERALLWSLGVVIVSGLFIWPYALDTGQAVVLLFALVASSPAAREPAHDA